MPIHVQAISVAAPATCWAASEPIRRSCDAERNANGAQNDFAILRERRADIAPPQRTAELVGACALNRRRLEPRPIFRARARPERWKPGAVARRFVGGRNESSTRRRQTSTPRQDWVISDAAASRMIPLQSRCETGTAQFQAPSRVATKAQGERSHGQEQNRRFGQGSHGRREGGGRQGRSATPSCRATARPKRPSARFQNAVGGVNDAVRDAVKKP